MKNLECNYDWKIYFTKGVEPGAFISYYGHLMIDYDFFKKLPKEEKLFVMFHEISHVLLRHSLEEFLVANEVFGLNKINDFDPDTIAYQINTTFVLPTRFENLIQFQEFEADHTSLMFLKAMNIDIKKAANFVLKMEQSKSMLFHSNTEKRKEQVLLSIEELSQN